MYICDEWAVYNKRAATFQIFRWFSSVWWDWSSQSCFHPVRGLGFKPPSSATAVWVFLQLTSGVWIRCLIYSAASHYCYSTCEAYSEYLLSLSGCIYGCRRLCHMHKPHVISTINAINARSHMTMHNAHSPRTSTLRNCSKRSCYCACANKYKLPAHVQGLIQVHCIAKKSFH